MFKHIAPVIAFVAAATGLGYVYEKFIAKSVGPAPAAPAPVPAVTPATPANPSPPAPVTPAPATSPVVAVLNAAQNALPQALGGGVTDTSTGGIDVLSGGDIGQALSDATGSTAGDAVASLDDTSSAASDLSDAMDALSLV